MKKRKNLINLGFTIYEALAVIVIIGVIASISVPIAITNHNKYNKVVFEQDCLMYEKVFLEVHKKFSNEYYGSTPLTKNIKLRVPFTNKINTEEEVFVDILNTTYVEYFIYETLFASKLPYENYIVEYSPAKITASFKFFPSVFKVALSNGTSIYYHLEVISSAKGSNQIAYFRKVDIVKDNFEYSFTI